MKSDRILWHNINLVRSHRNLQTHLIILAHIRLKTCSKAPFSHTSATRRALSKDMTRFFHNSNYISKNAKVIVFYYRSFRIAKVNLYEICLGTYYKKLFVL